ncbi:MAG TPA: hydrogenase expression/formation protein HypE, partial [Candidatus Limnocylindrales bacterium]
MSDPKRATIDPLAFDCPAPAPETERIILGHGSGGQLSAGLLRDLIGPALAPASPGGPLNDAAVVSVDGLRLAFTTDSFVVSPIEFPGGDIGELAVNGTINDLAMMGARPIALSLAYVIEEGLPIEELRRVTESAARAAALAGVPIVTGDTKVVGRGAADGVFVNTAGIGVVADGVSVGADRAAVGDAVILSGPIGLHGVAIMSVREGLGFEVEIESDTQQLADLVASVIAAMPDVHVLRDPTRGGLASALNEIATSSGVGIRLEEGSVPVPGPVRAACEMLGLDPLHVANEGKLIAIVPASGAEAALAAMHATPEGSEATI